MQRGRNTSGRQIISTSITLFDWDVVGIERKHTKDINYAENGDDFILNRVVNCRITRICIWFLSLSVEEKCSPISDELEDSVNPTQDSMLHKSSLPLNISIHSISSIEISNQRIFLSILLDISRSLISVLRRE